MRFFVLFLPASGYLRAPNTAKQGKTQNDKSTLFYPPGGGVLQEREAGRVSAAKWGVRGGGRLNIFFRDEVPTKIGPNAVSESTFSSTELSEFFGTHQKYPQYCWEFHDRLWEALSGTISEKRSAPSRTGGERILETLWKPQMP